MLSRARASHRAPLPPGLLLETLMAVAAGHLRENRAAGVDDLLRAMSAIMISARELGTPAGAALADLIMELGNRFADVLGDFADKVDLVCNDAVGSA